MDHRDAALELGLHLGIARGRKRQLAKLLVLLAEGTAAQCCGDPGDDYQILRLHGTSPGVFANEMRTAGSKRCPSGSFGTSSRDITPAIRISGGVLNAHLGRCRTAHVSSSFCGSAPLRSLWERSGHWAGFMSTRP